MFEQYVLGGWSQHRSGCRHINGQPVSSFVLELRVIFTRLYYRDVDLGFSYDFDSLTKLWIALQLCVDLASAVLLVPQDVQLVIKHGIFVFSVYRSTIIIVFGFIVGHFVLFISIRFQLFAALTYC